MVCEILWEPGGVYLKLSKSITGDDLLDGTRHIQGDARFDRLRYLIFDFLDVEEYSISENQAKRIAACNLGAAFTNPNIRFVIISDDEKIRQLAELCAGKPLISGPVTFFTKLVEARCWLQGQPPLNLPRLLV